MKIRTFLILGSLIAVFCSVPTSAPAADWITDVNIFTGCTTPTQVNCFESISAVTQDGKIKVGNLTGRSANYSISGNDAFLKHLIGHPQEWEFPGLKFENGNGKVLIFSAYMPKDFLHCWNNGDCQPLYEEFDTWMRPSNIDSNRPATIVTGENAKLACPAGQTSCDLGTPLWRFNQDVSFHLTVRLTQEFKAAYTIGRAKNFDLKEIARNATSAKYEVIVSPLQLENVNFVSPDISIYPQGLYVTDEPAVWVAGSNNRNVTQFGSCWDPNSTLITAGVKVLTNATQMGLPYWSSSDQMIKVYLQAPHLKTDGDVNSGYLEVGVPTNQAKCMWGINLKDQVQATVQFIDNNGSTQTITSSATLVNDSYQLRVSGFHYSSPLVGIKFKQDIVATPAPEPSIVVTPKPTPTTGVVKPTPAAIKSTITCVKGKTIKKITALKPTCPKGYLKK